MFMSSGKAMVGVMKGPPTVQTPQPQHDSKQAEEVTTCAQYILDQVPDDGLVTKLYRYIVCAGM